MAKIYEIVQDAEKDDDKVISLKETVVSETEQKFSLAQLRQDIVNMQIQADALIDAIAKKQTLIDEAKVELALTEAVIEK